MAAQNISQVDIGNLVHKSKGTVNSWIKRDTIPPADYALKIADFLGEDLRYLLTGKQLKDEYYYENKELKPVIDLLSNENRETIRTACISIKAALEISKLTREQLEYTDLDAIEHKTKYNAG